MSFVDSKSEQLSSLIGRTRDVVANLTRDQLSQRPDPNTWSVIEVIAHMNRTHGPYLHGLESLTTVRTAMFPQSVAPFRQKNLMWT